MFNAIRLFSSSVNLLLGWGRISTFKLFLEHIFGILPLSIESLQPLQRKFLLSISKLDFTSVGSENHLGNFVLLYTSIHCENNPASFSLIIFLNFYMSTSTTCFSNSFLSQQLHNLKLVYFPLERAGWHVVPQGGNIASREAGHHHLLASFRAHHNIW